jgi:hypothetical protein
MSAPVVLGIWCSLVTHLEAHYPFRVIWENGGGDSHVEWHTPIRSPPSRVLVNDVRTEGFRPIARFQGVTQPPYVKTVLLCPWCGKTEAQKQGDFGAVGQDNPGEY